MSKAAMLHDVWIPALHRDLTSGKERITVAGAAVSDLLAELEARFPGLEDRLCVDGRLRPGITVVVNGVLESKGLRTRLDGPSDVHFVPAIGGGTVATEC